MIKIRIANVEKDIDYLESTVPVLPRVGDNIGFWSVNKNKNYIWRIGIVEYLVYEFDEDHNFEMVEISIKVEQ
jgi:hypothetical protein